MKFKANRCLAVHLPDLKKAEAFYAGVLGLKLTARSKTLLEFDAGPVRFYVNRSSRKRPPIPSFTVKDLARAKRRLRAAGCTVTVDRGGSIYFRDPFGFTFDAVEA